MKKLAFSLGQKVGRISKGSTSDIFGTVQYKTLDGEMRTYQYSLNIIMKIESLIEHKEDLCSP